MKSRIIILALTGVVSYIIYWMILANLDFHNPEWLFYDENITFSEIRLMYEHIANHKWKSLIGLILHGSHIYGRILWYSNAVTSYIPFLIWGESGQIIATRLTQSIILIAAYWILVNTIVRSLIWRLFAVSLLILLPTTAYYACMPKPEPQQLLFLAAFFWYYMRREYKNGFYWFFIGASIGCKISAIFVLLVASLFSLNYYRKEFLSKDILKTIFSIYLGMMVAEPIFLLMLYPPMSIECINHYIGIITVNTNIGLDIPSVNVSDWVMFISNSLYSSRLLFILLTLFVLYQVTKDLILSNNFKKNVNIYLLLIVGILLVAQIIFMVKRLWGFYLHPGTVFIIVAVVSLLEKNVDVQEKNIQIWLNGITIFLFVIFSIFNGIKSIKYYRDMSNRTASALHYRLLEERNYIDNLIEEQFDILKRPVNLYANYDLYLNYNLNPKAVIDRFILLFNFNKAEQYDFILYRNVPYTESRHPSYTPNVEHGIVTIPSIETTRLKIISDEFDYLYRAYVWTDTLQEQKPTHIYKKIKGINELIILSRINKTY